MKNEMNINLLQMDAPEDRATKARCVGYVAFLIFAVTCFWGPAGPYLMLLFLLGWFVYSSRHQGSPIPTSPLVYLAWLSPLYIAASLFYGAFVYPDASAWHEQIANEYFRISGLWAVLLAPWLAGNRSDRNIRLLFAFALLGFLGEAAMSLPWTDMGSPNGRLRLIAGPNGSATVTGFFFLLVLTTVPRYLSRLANRTSWLLFIVAATFWVVILGTLLSLFVMTQSRSAWIAMVLALLGGIGAAGWLLWQGGRREYGRAACLSAACVVLITTVLSAYYHDLISRRYNQVDESLSKAVTLSLDDMDKNSVSYRIWMYQFGVRKLGDKPIYGWTPVGVRHLLREHAPPRIDRFGHIHNMPLEIYLGLGVIGFLLFYGMVLMSSIEVFQAARSGRMTCDLAAFWFVALSFIGIESIFDTRFFIYEVGLLMVLLGAVGIGCQLDRLKRRDDGHARESLTHSHTDSLSWMVLGKPAERQS